MAKVDKEELDAATAKVAALESDKAALVADRTALEAKLRELADQADSKVAALEDRLDEERTHAAAEIARLKRSPVRAGGKQPLAQEHKGEKTYIVGAGGHYRGNRLYKPGEKVTVVDEKPGKDWVLFDPSAPAPAKAAPPRGPAPAPAGRASDTNPGA